MFSRRTAFPTFLIFSNFYCKHFTGSPTKRRRGTVRVEGKELDN